MGGGLPRRRPGHSRGHHADVLLPPVTDVAGATVLHADAGKPGHGGNLRRGAQRHGRQTVLDILSYTRWPSEPARLRLCITAPTEYASSLLTIERQANGRPVEVHRYDMDDEALIQRCDVIYLGVLAPAQRLSLFESLRGHAILSISEQSRECIADAVFCLQAGEERVRFRVNLDALARSGVRVHPAVLKLARADEEVR